MTPSDGAAKNVETNMKQTATKTLSNINLLQGVTKAEQGTKQGKGKARQRIQSI